MNRPKWSQELSRLPELALSMPAGEFARHCEGLICRRFGREWLTAMPTGDRGRNWWGRNGTWATICLLIAEWTTVNCPEDDPALSERWASQLYVDIHDDRLHQMRNARRGTRCGQPLNRRSTLPDTAIDLPCSCPDQEWPVAFDPSGNTYPEGYLVVWAVKYLHLLNDCPTMLPDGPVTPVLTFAAELITQDPLAFMEAWKMTSQKRGR